MELFAKTCDYEVLNTERIAARVFVALGGLAWVVLTVGAAFVYPASAGLERFYPALLVTLLAVVALLIGWFYENLAAAVLFIGAAATIVWGSLMGWELGVWGVMAVFLITPEVIAGLLFLMAAQMQKVCELAE
jgi:hypothetical protein